MQKLKCAVIGTGYLGKFHAQKYANLPQCELVAVVDTNAETAEKIATEHGTQALTDYTSLLGKVDAVNLTINTFSSYSNRLRLHTTR